MIRIRFWGSCKTIIIILIILILIIKIKITVTIVVVIIIIITIIRSPPKIVCRYILRGPYSTYLVWGSGRKLQGVWNT